MEQEVTSIKERRLFPRIEAAFPIEISTGIMGEAVNLSETGLNFVLGKSLSISKIQAKIKLSHDEFIDVEFKIIWNRCLVEEGRFTYGARFTRLKESELEILRRIIIKTKEKDILEKIDDLVTKDKISDFWRIDLMKYIMETAKLSRKIDNKEISKKESEKIFFHLTDEIMQKASSLEKELSQKIIGKRIKQSFRELVGGWIYKGVIVKRALEKPRGYPGDYQTLEEIYNNQPLSDGIGHCSDKYFLENEYAVAVRNRKDKMKEMLADFIKNANYPSLKILNLACGSCREIKELFVDDNFSTNKEIIFTLIDQDAEALEYSKNLFLSLPANIKFNFIKENLFKLIKGEDAKKILRRHNLIYSIGLADYLPDRLLKIIMQFCIGLLDFKGKLIFTHKDRDRCTPVSPDWFCNWNFYSRNQKDLIDLIESIGGSDFSIETVARERSERILFLTIQKQI